MEGLGGVIARTMVFLFLLELALGFVLFVAIPWAWNLLPFTFQLVWR